MSDRPAHLGLHHVALIVSDLNVARHFYVELLGYQVEWAPDEENLYLSSGNDNLALHVGTPPSGEQRLDHIGILVSSAEAVSRWEEFLKIHQVEIAQSTRLHRDGATSCYVRDPDGTLLQILHHPPISPVLDSSTR